MKKYTMLLTVFAVLLLNGCTHVVTTPIHVAGAAAGATLDVAGSAAGAVVKTVSGGD